MQKLRDNRLFEIPGPRIACLRFLGRATLNRNTANLAFESKDMKPFLKEPGLPICDYSWIPPPPSPLSRRGGFKILKIIQTCCKMTPGWIPDRPTIQSLQKWPVITLGAPPRHLEDSTITNNCAKHVHKMSTKCKQMIHRCPNDHKTNRKALRVYFAVVSSGLFLGKGVFSKLNI